MGDLSFFLGLQVKQTSDGIFISQDKYVAEILKKFDFVTVKIASTPIESNKPLIKDEEAEDVDVHLYRSTIGSLMYLIASRLDIIFVVCACARFQVTLKTSHLHVEKRTFRYRKGQPKLGLWYPKDSRFDLEAYSDSDYSGASLDRKSTTGGCQFLGKRLISWQCKKLTIVANFTTEAEYVVAVICYGQVLWIQNQLLDYGLVIAKDRRCFVDTSEVTTGNTLPSIARLTTAGQSIRSDLHFDDAEGTACLLNTAIFEGLARMGTIASTIIYLADNQKFNFSKMKQRKEAEVSHDESEDEDHVPTPFSDPLPRDEDSYTLNELMVFCTSLQEHMFDLQEAKDAQSKEIATLKKKVSKLFKWRQSRSRGLRRLMKIDSLGTQEDASKQERIIEEIDQDDEIALDADTQGRKNDDEMFGVDDLSREEVVLDCNAPLRKEDRKEAEVSHDESEDEDHVPTPFSDPLPRDEDSYTLNELMVFCTSLQEHVFDLQEAKDAQSKEIVALKKKVSKLFKWRQSRSRGLRRLMKIVSGRRVKSPLEKDSLGAQEDASKQGRIIEEIDQDDEIALDADTQGRKNDDEMFGVDDLSREEVVLDTTIGEHEEQIIEDVSTAKPVNTAGEVVTTIADKVSGAPTTDVTEDEITMAQTLVALKSTKPKVVVQEQEVSTIILAAATIVTTAVPTPRAKGKAKMIKPKVPIKKKDQIRIDEDLLAERLQAREREEFSEVQKARLLVELIEKRKKHFTSLRAQEKRNKPPTKAQKRSQMCTYLRNIGRYKHSHLKGKSYDEIKKLFDREMRKVNNFIAMDSEAQKSSGKEAQESSTKRTAESLESDISKKQKVDKSVELVIDDTKELKKCMEIDPDDGDEVLIEATP
nr:uncharacterized mitochondrial protein AtMg00810-like [Tanacetum cinerariifolium]